jgi:uncharacterized protein YlbG (UPF0298 family)
MFIENKIYYSAKKDEFVFAYINTDKETGLKSVVAIPQPFIEDILESYRNIYEKEYNDSVFYCLVFPDEIKESVEMLEKYGR